MNPYDVIPYSLATLALLIRVVRDVRRARSLRESASAHPSDARRDSHAAGHTETL